MKSYLVLAALAALLLANSASASLHVTPANAIAFGNQGPGNPAVETAAAAFLGLTQAQLMNTELYRIGNDQAESGSLASSYTGSVTPLAAGASQFSAFTITYGSGPAIDPTYMLIKDGNNTPIWYLFDISAWDGTSTLSGSGFWPENGSISHVSVFGVQAAIPEPATIAVWAMLGMAGAFGAKKWWKVA